VDAAAPSRRGIRDVGVIEAALERGRDIRIGLEATVRRPDGSATLDNADLVESAVAVIRRKRRGLARPGQTA
jgi:uncharacterized protein (DUF849 family)